MGVLFLSNWKFSINSSIFLIDFLGRCGRGVKKLPSILILYWITPFSYFKTRISVTVGSAVASFRDEWIRIQDLYGSYKKTQKLKTPKNSKVEDTTSNGLGFSRASSVIR